MSHSNVSVELARLKHSSYWREQDGRVVVEALRKSGLPLATFARQHGLGTTRVRWWRNRLEERAAVPPVTSAALVPVTLVGTLGPTAKPSLLEVVLPSGHVVRVGTDFDAEALVKLVRVLETSC